MNLDLDEDIPRNKNIEKARLKPRSKFQPDFLSPKYACYIWKTHAPNFIKYIESIEAGIPDLIVQNTDNAIQDIWHALEDEEKTLDIVARYTNLAMHITPSLMKDVTTSQQIFHGIKYMVLTLSFIHARMVFIQISKQQFGTAEIYILNYENRKWWMTVFNANIRFGGKTVDEKELIHEIFDVTFNSLKSIIFEKKAQFDKAIECFTTFPSTAKLGDWKYHTWGNHDQYMCPERYFLTEDERREKILSLENRRSEFSKIPRVSNINPEFERFQARVKQDTLDGKMESIKKMMETGIFWTTVKCPRCAREQKPSKNLFYNPCKMCRNIQVTALLGHMPLDEKYFAWLGKETSDITEEEIRHTAEMEREEDERKEKQRRKLEHEKQVILEADKKDDAEEEEYSKRLQETRLSRETTNQMLAEADKLLEETVRFRNRNKVNLSDDFKEMIGQERRQKNIGNSIFENTEYLQSSDENSEIDQDAEVTEIELLNQKVQVQERILKNEIIE